MKAVLLIPAFAVALASTTAHANSIFPERFDLGFADPRDFAAACILSTALNGSMDNRSYTDVMTWCGNLAMMLFRMFPTREKLDCPAPRRCPPCLSSPSDDVVEPLPE